MRLRRAKKSQNHKTIKGIRNCEKRGRNAGIRAAYVGRLDETQNPYDYHKQNQLFQLWLVYYHSWYRTQQMELEDVNS